MTLFFYNLALIVALIAGAPWWWWKMATTHKYRAGLLERLGKVPKRLKPDATNGGSPAIWLHVVSVGEVLAATRLVAELDRALPQFRVLISTTTRTGQELARRRFGPERVFYCPLDLPWAVRAYLNVLRPHLLVLAETEFWPNLLSGCFRRGIPVTVVNARISDRSWPSYRSLRRLWAPYLSRLSRVLAQSETDAARLLDLGCRPECVCVAGNLKFDVRTPQENEAVRLLRRQVRGLRLVVGGSTLEGEEAALLEAWPRLLDADAQLAMVLAPRHPERFGAVAAMLEDSGYPWVRRADWSTRPTAALQPGTIVLLDTIGELAAVYSMASAAFVGGSLVPAGGHNPLEPAQYGAAVVMGPYYANFRSVVEDLRAHDGLRIVEKGELAPTLIALLRNRPAAEAMGARAKRVFDHQAGATARCVEAIRALLITAAAAERPA